MWQLAGKENLRGAVDVFQSLLISLSSFSAFPLRALTWESGFVSFMAPYISISICRLMALCQGVQSGVDCANDNVSHSNVSHVRHTERGCQTEDKETLPADVVLLYKWLMTLSVVVLWLRLQWFIATAHNSIKLHIYTQQNSVVLWSQCVWLCTHSCVIFIYYYYIVTVCI